MSPYRLANRCLLTASVLWVIACDTSTGSLISDDVQGLLAPQPDQGIFSAAPANGNGNETTQLPRVTSTLASPSVTSVSPTITIRGDNIVLLVHGENLSNTLNVELDNETSPCQVSELGNTSTGTVLSNLIEAECATRMISNRIMSVFDTNGNEITGSPISFTGTSITLFTPTASDTAVNSNASQTTSSTTLSTPTGNGSLAQSSSAPEAPVTSSAFALSAPTNLQLVKASESLQLTWDTVERAQGYSIFVSNATNPQPGVVGTSTYISYAPSIQITDFVIDQGLYIVVKAFLNNTESPGSEELKVEIDTKTLNPYAVPTLISGYDEIPANQGVFLSDDAYLALDQSSDGRYTVFLSRSSNLIANATEPFIQAYLHDKNTNAITLISQSSEGNVSNADISSPKISADGSVATFVSAATNLDEQFSVVDGVSNIFVRNLTENTTQLLSRSARISGASANANSFDPVIDSTGETIVYASNASDLAATAITQTAHLYHYDSSDSTTISITTSRSAQKDINDYSHATANALSADGEFLFYRHDVPGTLPTLHRVSLSTHAQLNLRFDSGIDLDGSFIRSVSDDGTKALIAYSNAQRSGIYNFVTHTFRDLGMWSHHTIPKDLSGNGQYAVFWSQDDLLPYNDITNENSGTHFVFDTQTDALQESSREIHSISGDGSIVLYTEPADSNTELIQLKSAQR